MRDAIRFDFPTMDRMSGCLCGTNARFSRPRILLQLDRRSIRICRKALVLPLGVRHLLTHIPYVLHFPFLGETI